MPPMRLPDPIQEHGQPFATPMPVQATPQARPGRIPAIAPVVEPTLPVPTPSSPTLPLPSITPAFTAAPQPGQAAISMLTTTESGMRDHSPWAPVLGIAVVSEVALLWVAACLSMWRRKLALSGGHPLPHPARVLTRMCGRLRKVRFRFRRRS
jgi:hypothetical protein